MVNFCPVLSKFYCNGCAGGAVRFHITDIVHIENANAEAPYAGGGKKQFPVKAKAAGAHKICPQYCHKAKEQEHIDISFSPVTVRIATQRVFHCTCNCGGAKHKHQDWSNVQQSAKSLPRHDRSKHYAKAHKHAYQHFHLWDGHGSAVESVLRALSFGRIRPL